MSDYTIPVVFNTPIDRARCPECDEPVYELDEVQCEFEPVLAYCVNDHPFGVADPYPRGEQ